MNLQLGKTQIIVTIFVETNDLCQTRLKIFEVRKQELKAMYRCELRGDMEFHPSEITSVSPRHHLQDGQYLHDYVSHISWDEGVGMNVAQWAVCFIHR